MQDDKKARPWLMRLAQVRMADWVIAAALLTVVVWLLAPQQVPVAGGTPSEAPTETAPRDAQPAREPEQGAAPVSEADEETATR